MLTSVNRFGNSSLTTYFWDMQERHYKTVLYFISAVILMTLAIQVYWNYKNYQVGKQQLINDVQVSLDNAVDRYYIDLAMENTLGFALSDSTHVLMIEGGMQLDPQFKRNNHGLDVENLTPFSRLKKDALYIEDSLFSDEMELRIESHFENNTQDSLYQNIESSLFHNGHNTSISIFGGGEKYSDTLLTRWSSSDSIKRGAVQWYLGDSLHRDNALARLTSRVIFSIASDTLELNTMNALVKEELSRKKVDVDYGISFTDPTGKKQFSNMEVINSAALSTSSKSGYLPGRSSLQLSFTNGTATILKNNLLGILLSFILMTAVVSSLLYLLRIIREQKQLAEIKNDFISNMTHEFKTPIATIGVALESIQHFNTSNDPEKTKKYVDMSSQQIGKLNVMVEKLLETATLDRDALALNKQESNLADLVEAIQQKYSHTHTEKNISFESNADQVWASIDAFHIENALDNIVDNAVKYGGDNIDIILEKMKTSVQITIQDNGQILTKSQASQIFEKFYRVPKGNTHDVKGFGIGLYYTKTIVEKHEGTLSVSTSPTTFKITLPYV